MFSTTKAGPTQSPIYVYLGKSAPSPAGRELA
jgi:hypothetical protein